MVTLGILVPLALFRAWRLGLRVYERITEPSDGQHRNTWPMTTIERASFDCLSRAWHERHDYEVALQPGHNPARTGRNSTPRMKILAKKLGFWGLSFLLIVIYIGINALGVVTTFLQTDTRAISQHPDAGSWIVNPNLTGTTAWDYSLPVEFQRQLDSAVLSENCFGPSQTDDGCSYFVSKNIPSNTGFTECPFQDACHETDNTALRLWTGAVDASTFGINAPVTYKFRRNATCSPLNMNSTFLEYIHTEEKQTFYYNYGGTKDNFFGGNRSWVTHQYGGYIADANSYSLDKLESAGKYWLPIPQLAPPLGHKTTLILIGSAKIFHTSRRSKDAIFRADTEITLPSGRIYYQDTRGYSAAIACLESTEIQDPSSETLEWVNLAAVKEPIHLDRQSKAGFNLLVKALVPSSMNQAISMRTSEVLVAQKKIANQISMPLEEKHWPIEMESIFKVSLARIMIETRDIARGSAKNHPGYVKLDEPEEERLCDETFIFLSEGYSNTGTVGYWLIFAICWIIIISAFPTFQGGLAWELVWKAIPDTKKLLAAPGELTRSIRNTLKPILDTDYKEIFRKALGNS